MEASRKAAAAAEEIGLPEIEGSEKQVGWAEVLRLAKLKQFEEAQQRGVFKPTPGQEAKVAEVLTAIRGQKAASFWIDNRENSPLSITVEFVRTYKAPAEREMEKDAAAEATVRPERVLSETVAEIRPFEDRIEVYFPERRDDFRQLIKRELHYVWAEKCWLRKLTVFTGDPVDRVAEVGHRILAAGFPIRIFDDGLRQKAVSGGFEPEGDRWVSRLIEAPYKDWFSIRWFRGDYYAEAKRLPASRYRKPSIAVPKEHFEEILDFAQVHDFKLTPGALELAEEARAARDAALKVTLAPVEKKPQAKQIERPALHVPETIEIPNEFKD